MKEKKASFHRKTMYKQRLYIKMHEGFEGTIQALAQAVGCLPPTAKNYIREWKEMDAEEQEYEYKRAMVALYGEPETKPEPVEQEQGLKLVHGFRTPYGIKRWKK